jgi:hypothetical protein
MRVPALFRDALFLGIMGRVFRKNGRPLSAKLKKEPAALSAMRDDEIDTSDIPELPRSAWKDAVRGRFYSSGLGSLKGALASKKGKGMSFVEIRKAAAKRRAKTVPK